MGLCPRCNMRLRASGRMRDEFDNLDDDYDLFDEEVDALIDEAVPGPPPGDHPLRRLAELLAYAATAIGDARDAYNTG